MNNKEKGIGIEKVNVIPKALLSEKAWERAVWRISRWASEEDRRAGKVYSREEAIKLFGVPQFTVVRGGILGALIALKEGTFFSTIRKKLERGFSFIGLILAVRKMFHGNVMLNEGINELFTIICSSSSGTKYDNVNAQTGVGDGTVAEDPTQTDLQGTNKTYKGMTTGFPTYGTNQKAVWKSEYLENEANYAWNEFIVRNGPTAAKDLLRKVSSQGTKVSGQVWELSIELTLS